MKATLLPAAVLLAFLSSMVGQPSKAQGVGTSADLTGTVIDPAGGNVPDAKITVTDSAKGVQRTTVSDERGYYRFSGLPPANYKVTVEHTGFETEDINSVVLTVGQTLVLDLHLKLAGTSAHVEVTSELPVIETERGSQSNTLTDEVISSLPIDRRDYLTFTLLMPRVSD
jgi:protocatechuate 3,4-dioxygenase beta subunit